MTKVLNLSDMVLRMTGGGATTPYNLFFTKDSLISGGTTAASTPVANQWQSLWQCSGNPGHGAAPTSEAIPTRATAGSLQQISLSAGVQQWLLSGTMTVNTHGQLLLYDRLVHQAGFDANVTTTNTLTMTQDRYPDGELSRNEAWVEIYTQVGVTQRTIRVVYEDSEGATQTVDALFGGTGLREAQRIIQMPRVGDVGVKEVQSVALLVGGTGTSGNYGITVARPLAAWTIGPGACGVGRCFVKGPERVEVKDDACLAFAWRSGSTTPPLVLGQIYMVQS